MKKTFTATACLISALMLLAGPAAGRVSQDFSNAARDCAKVPEAARAACQEAVSSRERCAQLKGAEADRCRAGRTAAKLDLPDCSALSGAEKSACGKHVEQVSRFKSCEGRTGGDFDRCAKSVEADSRASKTGEKAR